MKIAKEKLNFLEGAEMQVPLFYGVDAVYKKG